MENNSQLLHAKSSAYFGETRDRISQLLRLTIQTGFLTSTLSILMVALGDSHAKISSVYTLP